MEQAIYNDRKNAYLKNENLFQFCGFSKTKPLHSFGPAIRQHYVLHLVLKGKGVFYVKNKRYSLQEGDFFLIRPEESTYYQADEQDPWVYCWIGLSGNVVRDIFENFIFQGEQYAFSTKNIKGYTTLIKECLSITENTIEQELLLDEKVYRLLRLLCIDKENTLPPTEEKISDLTKQVILFVEQHLGENLNVSTLATTLSVDRSHLSRVFSKEMHTSLRQWLLSVKINHATYLLQRTNDSVANIAKASGFQSLEAFSRSFKNFTGSSPLKVREKVSRMQSDATLYGDIIELLEKQEIARRAT